MCTTFPQAFHAASGGSPEGRHKITNYGGSGMSVMEMSHRSKVFQKIFDDTQAKFRKLLSVPEGYKVLFLQGGASMQLPWPPEPDRQDRQGRLRRHRQLRQHRLQGGQEVRPGLVASLRGPQVHLYPLPGSAHPVPRGPPTSTTAPTTPSTAPSGSTSRRPRLRAPGVRYVLRHPVPPCRRDQVRHHLRRRPEKPGPAGQTIVIIKEELAGHELPHTPAIVRYKNMIDKDSMYNTPPCWLHLHSRPGLDWVEAWAAWPLGEGSSIHKATCSMTCWTTPSSSPWPPRRAPVPFMNVTFRTGNDDLDAKFVAESVEQPASPT